MKRTILAVLLTICIVLSFSSCSNSSSVSMVYSDIEKISDGTKLSGEESLVVAENDLLSLSVEPNTAAFKLTVKENNYIWNSVPSNLENDTFAKPAVKNMMRGQLVIECGDMKNHIVSTYNSYMDSVELGGLTVAQNENKGFTAFYSFPAISITIPVRYTLKEDHLEAEIVVGEILEEGDYKVLSAEFLSAFGAGSTSEQGYMVVPDGSGAVIEFNNKKTSYNNFSIPMYGSDIALVDKTISGYSKAYMPIFAINKGNNGMLAIISRGEAHSTVNAVISGKTSSYNTVYPSFSFRDYKTVSIDRHSGVVENGGNSFIMFDNKEQTLNSVAVEYYPLTEKNADYSGMAKRYGEYLAEKSGNKTSQKDKPALFLDIYGSINAEQKQLFTTVLKPKALTTFDEASEIIETLSKGGIESFNVQLKNWSSSGVNDKYTKKFDPLKKLGGEKALIKLSDLIEKNNGKLYLAADIQQFKSSDNALGLKETSKKIDNSQLKVSRVRRDNYLEDDEARKFSFISANSIPTQMQKLASLTPKDFGLSLINTEVYTDFGKNYSKRQQTANYIEQTAKEIEKNASAQFPNAFLMQYIDVAFGLGGQYGEYDVEDYGIPFYQIATKGLVSSSLESINLSANKQKSFLRSLEYGSSLMYTLTAKNSLIAANTKENALYNCDADTWKDEIIEKYTQANSVYEQIGFNLVHHERIAQNVFKSDFDKGSLIINYTDKTFEYNGITIQPNSYSIIKN